MANPLIRAASELWSAGSALFRAASLTGLREPARLPVRVISVGNIQVGGAGKTPLVAQIAREAHQRGLRVCILSRGYRGRWERAGGILAPGARAKTADCGDECALLRILAPAAFIGVGANRVQQFERIVASGTKIDLVILDDGFQNWRIRKDLEIVAVTSATPWNVLHRDWPGALARADLLVWTKGDEMPGVGESSAPMVKIRFAIPPAHDTRPVWLVAGVGDTASVLNAARAAGYDVAKPILLRDHARYSGEQVQELMRRAASAGARIALTGKDWVKWRDLGVAEGDVAVLEPSIEFVSGRKFWVKALWGSE